MNSLYINNIITENTIIKYTTQEINTNIVPFESSSEFILFILFILY